ncbi:MAG: UDP-N-acetylmuramate dehydrogenase [Cyanobacteria bacterium REEB459]|nr:UDP-N-acetylmuramate dehydrogenase [Cyanobacteria bacterium REEB459]
MTATTNQSPAFSLISAQASLHNLTTFRVGGVAEWLALPRHRQDVEASLAWAKAEAVEVTVLGAGSNLLISDRGIPGLVICTRHWRQSQFDPATGRVRAAAGEPLPTLAWKAAKRGWRGLEWAVGIPGTIGGAVVMNAGAHGGCVADSLVAATILNPQQQQVDLALADLAFQYRSSCLQGSKQVVLDATFQLQPGHDPAVVVADTLAGLNQRRASQPYDRPSCGSVFRNPQPYTAGWLIEQTGLKGYQLGQAQVAERHANFIVNLGGATATDIYRLIQHVQDHVEAQWSLRLQPEVKFIGEFSDHSRGLEES